MSPVVDRWTINTKRSDQPWAQVAPHTVRAEATVYVLSATEEEPESVYRKKFRSGAIIYPRVLLFVHEIDAGPLGAGSGRTPVESRRSEKKPWNTISPLRGVVETQFLVPVHLGETILPFRALEPVKAVVPINPDNCAEMLTQAGVDRYPALAAWWGQVEATWARYRRTDERADLIDRVDYSNQLSAQPPLSQHRHRVVYTKSGNSLSAARLEGDESLIENKLYWAPTNSVDEGRYLVGILNSSAMKDAVAPMQSIGLFGTRDFDKLVFRVPFPAFDRTNADHRRIADVVRKSEAVAENIDVGGAPSFRHARTLIRAALASVGLDAQLENAVERVLPAVSL